MHVLPSKAELNQGIIEFEKCIIREREKVNIRFEIIKKDHPFFNELIGQAIEFLPTPFDKIAKSIYNNFQGTNEDKINKVLKFFEIIRKQTDGNYKNIVDKLDTVLDKISIMIRIIEKEDSLNLLKEILISQNRDITNKLRRLEETTDIIKDSFFKVEQEILNSGVFEYIQKTYFEEHDKNIEWDFNSWKNGSEFKFLSSIKEEKEFRREKVIQDIENKLEKYGTQLIKGEHGTSKSTILMEIICDYYKKDYTLLWNRTSHIENPVSIKNYIENLLSEEKKILVAVDDVHDKRKSKIFFVWQQLRSHKKYNNVKFVMTASIPNYDWFTEERLLEIDDQIYRESIRDFNRECSCNEDLEFKIPLFTKEEIKEFIIKYKDDSNPEFKQNIESHKSKLMESSNVDLEQKVFDNISEELFVETKGIPIMLKFKVFKNGLKEDVEDRFFDYFHANNNRKQEDGNKIQAMSVCSFLEIGNFPITESNLSVMNILFYAESLIEATLYYSNIKGLLNTIHKEWDKEFLKYVYNKNKHIDNNVNLYSQREKRLLCNSLCSILLIKDEEIKKEMYHILYDLAREKIISPKLVDDVFETLKYEEKVHLNNKELSQKITLYKAHAYYENGNAKKEIDCYNMAVELDDKNVDAWFNKGLRLDKIGKREESIASFEKALSIDNNDSGYWTNKAAKLIQIGKDNHASKFLEKAIMIDKNYKYAHDLEYNISYPSISSFISDLMSTKSMDYAQLKYNTAISKSTLSKDEDATYLVNIGVKMGLEPASCQLSYSNLTSATSSSTAARG